MLSWFLNMLLIWGGSYIFEEGLRMKILFRMAEAEYNGKANTKKCLILLFFL